MGAKQCKLSRLGFGPSSRDSNFSEDNYDSNGARQSGYPDRRQNSGFIISCIKTANPFGQIDTGVSHTFYCKKVKNKKHPHFKSLNRNKTRKLLFLSMGVAFPLKSLLCT
jgi:hypothetical protein